ncbi:erythropoietin b isoform X2 [Sinocyclocheilus anshuiensis]|uniref:erythropoietin b isoform X2 n=1 Tax=Sinocyclocheilus anshuiensis TaxID=1608454 RepID=UPI0007B851C5|nr:PREDICTED: erythropoietin-like isoform X2 [Sinocyclocheilus anshuiensis]
MQTFSGLVSVLIVFVWLGGNQVSPLRPICDLRVLEHFIREAQDSEVIMRGCRGGCGAMKSYFVPLTSVDFAFWEHIDVHEQAVEVQTGLSLLVQALSTAMKAVSNSRLASALDNNISNIHSLSQILHSLDLQARSTVLPDDSAPASTQSQEVSSLPELLQVQSSFLRGKVRLLLSAAPACQRQNS